MTMLNDFDITVMGDSIAKGLFLKDNKIMRIERNTVKLMQEHYGVSIENFSRRAARTEHAAFGVFLPFERKRTKTEKRRDTHLSRGAAARVFRPLFSKYHRRSRG